MFWRSKDALSVHSACSSNLFGIREIGGDALLNTKAWLVISYKMFDLIVDRKPGSPMAYMIGLAKELL